MLLASPASEVSDFDRAAFEAYVPLDHYLRRVRACIDFERFRPQLEAVYVAAMGRPSLDPVRMLKIGFLGFHYDLSDRQVMVRIQTDLAFRWFLDLGCAGTIPNHTNGTHFRARVGTDRFNQVFQELVTLAREHGLVSDHLRLKDATHIFANVADLRPLQLVAQVRDHLLAAAAAFFVAWVLEQRTLVEALRQATAELPHEERLAS